VNRIRRRLVVRGRVQGVFYRDSVRRIAEARGVAGTAINREDGSVEVVLEGPEDAVEELIAYCADGPERAEVSGVEVAEEEPEGLAGFRTG
jgi:acylphosphatase